MTPTSPIAVIDSGLGGLTVARALHARLPHEKIVYFGDTARLPYGAKSAATVATFVDQIINHLRRHDPKHVVLACNTATALALPAARAAFPGLPVSGVIEPGAKAAVHAAGSKEVPTIGVIATEATARSKAYAHAIGRRRHHARILTQPTPLLCPMIEEGRRPDDPLVKMALEQYLLPLGRRHMDVLVLGCTHYPVLKDLIQRVVGGAVRVIDSAEQCAEDVARRLRATGLMAGPEADAGGADPTVSKIGPAAGTSPWLRCFVTDDPTRFARLAPRFLGERIDPPTWVAPDELYGLPVSIAAPDPADPAVRRAV